MVKGLCECGCGQATAIAKRTYSRQGWFKGEPVRFVTGHNSHRLRKREWIETLGPLETPCWLWQGTITKQGYGQLRVEGRTTRAHRWVWEQERGPCPDAPLEADHLCRNRACVNPAHIEWVTAAVNTRRKASTTVTAEQVLEARRLRATTNLRVADIAEKVGIGRWNAHNIIRGRTWRDLT